MFKAIIKRDLIDLSKTLKFKTSIRNFSGNTNAFNSIKTKDQQPQHLKPSDEKPISPHSIFYRQFSKPFIKCCLLSIATYYSLQLLWEYLESSEEKQEKTD